MKTAGGGFVGTGGGGAFSGGGSVQSAGFGGFGSGQSPSKPGKFAAVVYVNNFVKDEKATENSTHK